MNVVKGKKNACGIPYLQAVTVCLQPPNCGYNEVSKKITMNKDSTISLSDQLKLIVPKGASESAKTVGRQWSVKFLVARKQILHIYVVTNAWITVSTSFIVAAISISVLLWQNLTAVL